MLQRLCARVRFGQVTRGYGRAKVTQGYIEVGKVIVVNTTVSHCVNSPCVGSSDGAASSCRRKCVPGHHQCCGIIARGRSGGASAEPGPYRRNHNTLSN